MRFFQQRGSDLTGVRKATAGLPRKAATIKISKVRLAPLKSNTSLPQSKCRVTRNQKISPCLPSALPDTVWGFSSRATINIDNPTTGQYYWFRVKAVGPRKNSGFSDLAVVMAA